MRDIGGRRREDCLHNHIQGVSPISAEAAEEFNWALAQAAGTAGTPLLGPPHQDGCSASSSGASPWDQQHERGFPGKQVEGRCLLSIFPQGDSEEKNQISTLATHGSCGMYLQSSAGTPSPLLCRSRDIIRAVLWTILVLRRCQEDSHFKTGLFSPLWRHYKKMSIFKKAFSGLISKSGEFCASWRETAVRVKVHLQIIAAARPKPLCGANSRAESSTQQCPCPPISVPRAPPGGLPGHGSLPQKQKN